MGWGSYRKKSELDIRHQLYQSSSLDLGVTDKPNAEPLTSRLEDFTLCDRREENWESWSTYTLDVGDVISDIKDEAIFKPAAEALYQKRLEDLGRDYPPLHCISVGPVQTLGETYRIMQSPPCRVACSG